MKMKKAAILQETVTRMEQLQMLVVQLAEVCKQQESDVGDAAVPSVFQSSAFAHLDHLPRFVSSTVQSYLRRVGLHSSMFIHSSASQLLLHARSGLIADANERFLTNSGWKRTELVGRRLFPPARLMQTNPQIIQNRQSRLMTTNRLPVQGKNGRTVPQKQVPQYGRTLERAKQLWNGEIEAFEAVWRGQLRDGKMYERKIYCWVSEWEEVECGGGVRKRQPAYIMSVQQLAEPMCVEH